MKATPAWLVLVAFIAALLDGCAFHPSADYMEVMRGDGSGSCLTYTGIATVPYAGQVAVGACRLNSPGKLSVDPKTGAIVIEVHGPITPEPLRAGEYVKP
jgi:hypothetical protein